MGQALAHHCLASAGVRRQVHSNERRQTCHTHTWLLVDQVAPKAPLYAKLTSSPDKSWLCPSLQPICTQVPCGSVFPKHWQLPTPYKAAQTHVFRVEGGLAAELTAAQRQLSARLWRQVCSSGHICPGRCHLPPAKGAIMVP